VNIFSSRNHYVLWNCAKHDFRPFAASALRSVAGGTDDAQECERKVFKSAALAANERVVVALEGHSSGISSSLRRCSFGWMFRRSRLRNGGFEPGPFIRQ
jgi:hypothetical protein